MMASPPKFLDPTCSPGTNGPPRAALYGRASLDFPDSVPEQWQLTREYAERDGYVVPTSPEYLFGDNNMTGKISERRDFRRLEQIVLSGRAPFSRVYVKDKSRWGRWNNPHQHAIYETTWRHLGVEIYYCQDRNVNFDDGVRDEDIGFAVVDLVNNIFTAKERIKTVQRTTQGMRASVIAGSFPGCSPYAAERWYHDADGTRTLLSGSRGRRPPGTLIKIQWSAAEALVVKRIYDSVEKGLSLKLIADSLNEGAIPSPGGSRWTGGAVRRIARNPLYTGDLVWGRTTRLQDAVPHTEASVEGEAPVVFRDFAPSAPIRREQFERVQEILDGTREQWDRRRAVSPDYLLSGLVRCASCGEGFHGHTRPKRTDGSRLRYYRHDARGLEDCPGRKRNFNADALEGAVTGAVRNILDMPDLQELTRAAIEDRIGHVRSGDMGTLLEAMDSEIRKLDAAADQASENAALAAVSEDRERHLRTSARLSERAASLRQEREKMDREERLLREAAEGLRATQETRRPPSEIWSDGDLNTRREVLASLVERIDLDPDKARADIVVR